MTTQKGKSSRKSLGEKLKVARLNLKLTQNQVAQMTGITSTYYAMVERGEANPSYEKLQKILKALEIKSIDLD